MMKFFISLAILLASSLGFASTCTTYSRSNYSANQILTASALNADFNNLTSRTNAFDGGCVTDGSLEAGALNATDYAVVLSGIQQGCLVSYTDSNTLSISRCMASVNGRFVKTTAATPATWGCSGCSSEVSATVYYLYIKTGSTGTTLTPFISTIAPNADGYDASGNKALAKFYNDGSSNIDRNYLFMWNIFAFQDETNPIPAGTVWATSASTCSSGWLAADGTAVSRATYARLYAAIGVSHGQGDNSTTFNVPDYRGRFLRGVDGSAGNDPDKASRTAMATGGNTANNVGSVQNGQFTSHTHDFIGYGGGAISNTVVWSSPQLNVGSTSPNIFSANILSAGGNETRPVNAYVTYCVKY
jgi:microcystin-dependent protein